MSRAVASIFLGAALAACDDARPVTDATAPPVQPAAPRPAPPTPAEQRMWTWSFEADVADQAPGGFSFGRTGKGSLGRWLVKADGGAKVLAQVDSDDTSFRFPVAVANQPELVDVRVAVRCKPISGRVDQACGLVARYRDESNYLITRANALEGNIRLYTVRDGKREEIADHRGPVTARAWHDLRLDIVGDHAMVFWDGQRVIDKSDVTFRVAGRVGLWTKADSLTYFDDLRVEAL